MTDPENTEQIAGGPLGKLAGRVKEAAGSALGKEDLAREQARAPFPGGVRFVSLYSRSDGIVDWRTCLVPAAELVEVGGSHVGMAVNPSVFRAVGSALAAAPAPGR